MSEEIIIEKQKPQITKIILAVLISAIVFGLIGYVFGKKTNSATPSAPTAETATIGDLAVAISSKTASPVVSATTSKAAEWKTYSNSTEGFSFSYPSGWKLEEGPSETSPRRIVSVESNIPNPNKTWLDGTKYYDRITVNKEAEPTIADWINTRLATGQENNSKKVTINNAEYTEIVPGSDPDYLAELKISNGTLYSIIFRWASGRSDISSTEEKILSTFQFTK